MICRACNHFGLISGFESWKHAKLVGLDNWNPRASTNYMVIFKLEGRLIIGSIAVSGLEGPGDQLALFLGGLKVEK